MATALHRLSRLPYPVRIETLDSNFNLANNCYTHRSDCPPQIGDLVLQIAYCALDLKLASPGKLCRWTLARRRSE